MPSIAVTNATNGIRMFAICRYREPGDHSAFARGPEVWLGPGESDTLTFKCQLQEEYVFASYDIGEGGKLNGRKLLVYADLEQYIRSDDNDQAQRAYYSLEV